LHEQLFIPGKAGSYCLYVT